LVELIAPAPSLPKPRQGAANDEIQHQCGYVFADAIGAPAAQKEDRQAAGEYSKEEGSESFWEEGVAGATNLARNEYAHNHRKTCEPEWPQQRDIDR
jgi:hypothetical protein